MLFAMCRHKSKATWTLPLQSLKSIVKWLNQFAGKHQFYH